MIRGYRVYYDFDKCDWFCGNEEVEVKASEVSVVNFYKPTYEEAVKAVKRNRKNVVVKTCVNCKKPFVLSKGQINWFLDRKLKEPRRCVTCRGLAKNNTDME